MPHAVTAETKAKAAGVKMPPLPDPTIPSDAAHPFQSDPGWREAWWWLLIPVCVASALIWIFAIHQEWYMKWILPEGYGVQEVGHLFMPLGGLAIAVYLLYRPFVQQRLQIYRFLLVMALGCLYMAGEEHSWGQHFFHWETPEFWSNLNRQQETNFHNLYRLHVVLDKFPRTLLETAIFVGGLLVPLIAVFKPKIRRIRWAFYLPASALAPTAAGLALFKLNASFHDFGVWDRWVARPAESGETFIYMFVLFYLIIIARRVRELEQNMPAQAKTSG